MPRTILGSLVGALLLIALATAGCGMQAEGGNADVRIVVTRDFGSTVLGAQIQQNVPDGESVLSLAQRSFDVETRAGGSGVQSIDRLAGSGGARADDWFYWVNGIVGDDSAADFKLHGGDRVWWDHHDAGGSDRVRAVVGQYPEPFAHGAEGKRYPVVLQCAAGADAECDLVAQQLAAVGASPSRQALGTNVETEVLKVLVGPWSVVRRDQALRLIDQGPAESGVFARFDAGGRQLELIDPQGRTARTLGAGAGLVAAVKLGEQVPTWAITGTDLAGVRAAADALVAERLRDRFALATDAAGDDAGLPLQR
jgi:hypothetical protein